MTSQHDQQTLTDPAHHLALLDASARLEPQRAAMSSAHVAFAEATAALERVLQDIRQRADREDLLRYQLKEIDELPRARRRGAVGHHPRPAPPRRAPRRGQRRGRRRALRPRRGGAR
ncbi:MAG: hypothetical protein R3A48_10110 [Polyangiales bacterium]